jgi:hypothetical protein
MERLEAIEANLCPGGVVVRLYVDRELFTERKLVDGEEAAMVGVMDRNAALLIAKEVIEIATWDGDSGEPRVLSRMFKFGPVWAVDTWMSPAFIAASRRDS